MTASPATENPDAAQVGPPPPFDPELRPALDALAGGGRPPYTLDDIPLIRSAPTLVPLPVPEVRRGDEHQAEQADATELRR